MAWRNIPQGISASIPQNIINDPESFITAFSNASTPQQKEAAYATYIMPTWNGADSRDITQEKLLGDDTNYVNITTSSSSYLVQAYFNSSIIQFAQSDFKSADYTVCYVALVDDDTQLSFFSCFLRYRQNAGCGQVGGTNPVISGTMSQQIYTILTANPYVQYTWTSVPAISGKMGILSLSQVASTYLNDGDPVASAPRSYISVLSAASNIGNLVLGASLDMTKVVATYFIPDDISQEADYIKLVYKVNSEPESVSDGTAVTITSEQTQTIIDGICDGNTYYFKIFTDEYTSNTVIITTEA